MLLLRLTQTQTKFIQQKYIQVPYQVYMSFLEIQITLYSLYMNNHRHVGRHPLRSYLTADMKATRKGKACAAVMDANYNVMFNL